MAVIHKDGLSTAVRIRLEVGDQVLRVAQVGDGSLILKAVCHLAPTEYANVVISVDGDELVYPVVLPEGIDGRIVQFRDAPCCDLPHAGDSPGNSDCPF